MKNNKKQVLVFEFESLTDAFNFLIDIEKLGYKTENGITVVKKRD